MENNSEQIEKSGISFYEIAEYWIDKNISEDGDIIPNSDLNNCEKETMPVVVDIGEPRCFCCGAMQKEARDGNFLNSTTDLKKIWNSKLTTKHFEKAHIIAKSLGGKSITSNMFCLCKECHRESPDTVYPEVFFSWIYRRRKYPKLVSIYDDAIATCKKRGIPLFYLTPPNPSEDQTLINEVCTTHKFEMVDSTKSGLLVGLANRRKQKIEAFIEEMSDSLYTKIPEIIMMIVGYACQKEIGNEDYSKWGVLDDQMEAMLEFTASFVSAFKNV